MEEGTNIAFLAIQEMLKFVKDAAGPRSPNRQPRPYVTVKVMLIYNSEIFDLLSESRKRSRIRFNKAINKIEGSKNQHCQYLQATGLSHIEVSGAADLELVMSVAQQHKLEICERLKVELNELTKRSALVVRAEVSKNPLDRPKLFDFVELPISNVLSA